MGVIDEVVDGNAAFASGFEPAAADLHAAPVRGLAVLACMDARLDVHALLGLRPGDAHVIRNAGGVVTDDAIRSLVISQRLLGTRAVVLVHHTDCGMLGFRDDELKVGSRRRAGCGRRSRSGRSRTSKPTCVSRGADHVQPVPAPPRQVRGFVYDVRTGRLTEVAAGDPAS